MATHVDSYEVLYGLWKTLKNDLFEFRKAQMLPSSEWQTSANSQLDILEHRIRELYDRSLNAQITASVNNHWFGCIWNEFSINRLFMVQQPRMSLMLGNKLKMQLRLLAGDRGLSSEHIGLLTKIQIEIRIISIEDAQMVFDNKLLAHQARNRVQFYQTTKIGGKARKEALNACRSSFTLLPPWVNGAARAQFQSMQFMINFENIELDKETVDRRNRIGKRDSSEDSTLKDLYCFLFFAADMPSELRGTEYGNAVFGLKTISLPFTLMTHSGQACKTEPFAFWARAFALPNNYAIPSSTNWLQFKSALNRYFLHKTSAKRALSEADLKYCQNQLGFTTDNDIIDDNAFEESKLHWMADRGFTFWHWFSKIATLIENELLEFWDKGWLVGFMDSNTAEEEVKATSNPVYLLRFSNRFLRAVSVTYCKIKNGNQEVGSCLYGDESNVDVTAVSLQNYISRLKNIQDIDHIRIFNVTRGCYETTNQLPKEFKAVRRAQNGPLGKYLKIETWFKGKKNPVPLSPAPDNSQHGKKTPEDHPSCTPNSERSTTSQQSQLVYENDYWSPFPEVDSALEVHLRKLQEHDRHRHGMHDLNGVIAWLKSQDCQLMLTTAVGQPILLTFDPNSTQRFISEYFPEIANGASFGEANELHILNRWLVDENSTMDCSNPENLAPEDDPVSMSIDETFFDSYDQPHYISQ